MKKYNQSEIELLVKQTVKSAGNLSPDELRELCCKVIYSQYSPTKKVLSYINYNLCRDIMRNITLEQYLTNNF